MDIKLNFINQSNDSGNSNVVVFQKNLAPGADAPPIAWLVIAHCGEGDRHPFDFPSTMGVNASDSYGN